MGLWLSGSVMLDLKLLPPTDRSEYRERLETELREEMLVAWEDIGLREGLWTSEALKDLNLPWLRGWSAFLSSFFRLTFSINCSRLKLWFLDFKILSNIEGFSGLDSSELELCPSEKDSPSVLS